MGLDLSKGQSLNLSKSAPASKKFIIGLGWESTADLDASAFMLNNKGKFAKHRHFVWYKNLATPEQNPAIVHSGDKRDGTTTTTKTGGDDEQITVNIANIPDDIHEISILATILEAAQNGNRFGQVKDAYIRICDPSQMVGGEPKELARYNLQDEFASFSAVHFGSLMRRPNGDWAFEAVGVGSNGDLNDIYTAYSESEAEAAAKIAAG